MPWGLPSQDAVPSLSIVILTRNEARNIVDCVRSARFADEVLVLDSGSTDGTPELARAEGATVSVSADWPGFGPQKNRVLAQATGDWVFSLDADERITPPLREAILQAIAAPSGKVAFQVDRTSSYCGQVIRHSGWSPDWVLRLFRRDCGRFSDDLVHERVVVQGPTGRLAGGLLHDSMPNLESVVDKINRYSTAGAQMLVDRGRRATLGQALSHGAWAFFRTYVLRRGFLDGSLGLALAISNAEGTYYRYLKAWLAQRNANAPSRP